MKYIFIILFLSDQLLSQSQPSFEGIYNGHMNNDEIQLHLNQDQKNQYSGKMTDSQQHYVITAKSTENKLVGTATEAKLGLVFKITGNW